MQLIPNSMRLSHRVKFNTIKVNDCIIAEPIYQNLMKFSKHQLEQVISELNDIVKFSTYMIGEQNKKENEPKRGFALVQAIREMHNDECKEKIAKVEKAKLTDYLKQYASTCDNKVLSEIMHNFPPEELSTVVFANITATSPQVSNKKMACFYKIRAKTPLIVQANVSMATNIDKIGTAIIIHGKDKEIKFWAPIEQSKAQSMSNSFTRLFMALKNGE